MINNFELNKKDFFLNFINIENILEIDFLKNYIKTVSYNLNKREEDVFLVALLFLSNAINNKLFIQHTENKDYIITSNLWGVVIGEPGSGKTPLTQSFKKFLTIAENYYNKDKEKELMIFETIKKNIQKNPSKKNLEKLNEILNNPPRTNFLYLNDITREALLKYLFFNEQGILLSYDELSSLFSKFTKDQAFRPLLLEGWNGIGNYKYTTLKHSTIHIKNFTIGIIANTQPSLFKKIFLKSEDGFIERFQIFVNLTNNQPPRIKNKIINNYINEKMQNLFFQLTNPNLSLNFSNKRIKFSTSALTRFILFKESYNQYFNQESRFFKNYWSKIDKLILSLSLIFFLLRFFYTDNKNEEINVRDLEKALTVTKYILNNVKNIENQFLKNTKENNDLIEKKVVLKIFQFLRDHNTVPFRIIIQNVYDIKNNSQLIAVLNNLKLKYPIEFEKNKVFLNRILNN